MGLIKRYTLSIRNTATPNRKYAGSLEKGMEANMKKYGFVIFTAILLLITTFGAAGTVMGKDSGRLEVQNSYYHDMEKEYVKETRACLKELGYENAGVSMTMVTNQDGSHKYTVSIHHKSINRMKEQDKQSLLNQLKQIKFPEKNCNISHKFLNYNC